MLLLPGFLGQKQYERYEVTQHYGDDLEGYKLDPNSLVIEYEGLQLKEILFCHNMKLQSSYRAIPDYNVC